MTNLEKGNCLEEAVRRIETSIIQGVPGYSDARFSIESKKIITVQGVRHEFDIWVTARIATGYQSVFVFECRNREEKANKNDIIVFSEKVRAVNATRGFFVAKSFTQDALAQAALDSRVETLIAEELDAVSFDFREAPLRTDFSEEEAYFSVLSVQGAARSISMELPFEYRGERMTAGKFLGQWFSQCKDVFPALILPSGEYPYAIESTVEFVRGEAFLVGVELTSFGIFVSGVAALERAAIVSAFDVATRGRAISYEFNGPKNYPDGLMVDTGPINITLTPIGE